MFIKTKRLFLLSFLISFRTQNFLKTYFNLFKYTLYYVINNRENIYILIGFGLRKIKLRSISM